ncbi:MAG: O-methyltransferase [Clostridia bacterium]|nr:O-methyltransferase [Clostridia bacterium]
MEELKRFQITDGKVENYISGILSPYAGLLGKLREYASKNSIPIIGIETSRLLEILVEIKKPGRILEIGTAIGYSSVLMSKSLADGGVIDTIEIDPEFSEIALANFREAGCRDKINMITADAADVLRNINKHYDFILIDAAKGQYPIYYEFCSGMLTPGGIIFADNVLYRGMTAGGAKIKRRRQLLVRRLREYIEMAVDDDRFITDVLSIGDGVCISYRKENA